jgi:hypothetical protein
MLHSAIVLAAWSVANRETVDLMALKQHVQTRESVLGHREAAARRLAVGYALALLQTGLPDGEPCAVDIRCGPEAPLRFRLDYEEVSDEPPRRWKVRVSKVDPETALPVKRVFVMPEPPPAS